MGFGSFLKNVAKQATSIGKVSGSSFPLGTYINFSNRDENAAIILTYSVTLLQVL